MLALYGHPDSGGIWEKHCEDQLKTVGWTPVNPEIRQSIFYHAELDLLLVIYVDDFKMAGPSKNLDKGWKTIESVIDMDPPEPFGRYFGCNHFEKHRPQVREDYWEVDTELGAVVEIDPANHQVEIDPANHQVRPKRPPPVKIDGVLARIDPELDEIRYGGNPGGRSVANLQGLHVGLSDKFRVQFLEDNQATITIVNKGDSEKMRHTESAQNVSFGWLKQQFEAEHFDDMVNVDTLEQVADIFTKPFAEKTKWLHALRLINHNLCSDVAQKWGKDSDSHLVAKPTIAAAGHGRPSLERVAQDLLTVKDFSYPGLCSANDFPTKEGFLDGLQAHVTRCGDAFLVFAGLQAQQFKDRADEQLRLHDCISQHQHHSSQHRTKDRYDAKVSDLKVADLGPLHPPIDRALKVFSVASYTCPSTAGHQTTPEMSTVPETITRLEAINKLGEEFSNTPDADWDATVKKLYQGVAVQTALSVCLAERQQGYKALYDVCRINDEGLGRIQPGCNRGREKAAIIVSDSTLIFKAGARTFVVEMAGPSGSTGEVKEVSFDDVIGSIPYRTEPHRTFSAVKEAMINNAKESGFMKARPGDFVGMRYQDG
eukprot:s1696_g9.t1